MAGEGLERLGYYNGQRLEAPDYRLEQRYHIDVRRLLNRGLFTPGVVSGFVVEEVEGQTRKVRVRQGVALDAVGREIVLLEDVLFDVPNQKPTEGPGYLLVARYSEQAVEGGDPWCSGPTGAPRPARLREEALLEWSQHAPDHGRCTSGNEGIDCGVVLAFATLTNACEVDEVVQGVREYALPRRTSQIPAFSFEGEKDIDVRNPKRLRFTINGVVSSAQLYLWGERFSTLYYSELGQHSHSFDSWPASSDKRPTDPASALDEHTHDLPDGHGTTVPTPWVPGSPVPPLPDGYHDTHLLLSTADGDAISVPLVVDKGYRPGSPVWIIGGQHSHSVAISFDDPTFGVTQAPGTELHRHTLPDTSPFGAADVGARGPHEKAYAYLNDLRVGLRVGTRQPIDVTKRILDRLPTNWGSLGTGNPNHPLNTEGTGPIDILAIAREVGVDLSSAGTHELRFSVKSGGGKIAYNLFVA